VYPTIEQLDLTSPPEGLDTSPEAMELLLTGKCNLTCKYCFYADEMTCLKDLPTDRWLNILDEMGQMAVQLVTLTGGEVFTRPDIFQIIDGVIKNRMRYRILTNGTLITQKIIDQFNVGKRRLRLDLIQISIDGSTSEIHDKSRPNSFTRAIRGLRMLAEQNFPVTVRVTINRHNVHDLENIAQLLLEEIGIRNFSTNETIPMGAAKCAGEALTLTHEQRHVAMKVLLELDKKYPGRITASAGPLALAKRLNDINACVACGQTSKPEFGRLTACASVFNKMSILHDGTIVPCSMLPRLTMGVAGRDSLQDAWIHHPSINIVRQRREIPLSALSTCQDCRYVGFCTGGCPGMVMNQTQQLNSRDTTSCYRILMGEETNDDAD